MLCYVLDCFFIYIEEGPTEWRTMWFSKNSPCILPLNPHHEHEETSWAPSARLRIVSQKAWSCQKKIIVPTQKKNTEEGPDPGTSLTPVPSAVKKKRRSALAPHKSRGPRRSFREGPHVQSPGFRPSIVRIIVWHQVGVTGPGGMAGFSYSKVYTRGGNLIMKIAWVVFKCESRISGDCWWDGKEWIYVYGKKKRNLIDYAIFCVLFFFSCLLFVCDLNHSRCIDGIITIIFFSVKGRVDLFHILQKEWRNFFVLFLKSRNAYRLIYQSWIIPVDICLKFSFKVCNG